MTKKTKTSREEDELLKNLPARMDIRVDWAFKHLFGKKKHLIKIIKDLLDIDIEVLEYLPNGLDVVNEQDKKSVFDVICQNIRTREKFVLEMQTTYRSDMMDRLYYYGGSLIHNQMTDKKQKYEIDAVLICCIASYRVPHKEKVPEGKVFFQYKMMERDTHSVFDGDKFNICFLELERFDNYLDKDSDLKEQWCWIFNNLTTFVRRPEHLDSSFDDIIEDAETRKLTPEEKLKYMESRQLTEYERTVIHEGGIIIGREEGFAEGIKEGEAQGKIKSAKQLIAHYGLKAEEVAQLLGVQVEDLQ